MGNGSMLLKCNLRETKKYIGIDISLESIKYQKIMNNTTDSS